MDSYIRHRDLRDKFILQSQPAYYRESVQSDYVGMWERIIIHRNALKIPATMDGSEDEFLVGLINATFNEMWRSMRFLWFKQRPTDKAGDWLFEMEGTKSKGRPQWSVYRYSDYAIISPWLWVEKPENGVETPSAPAVMKNPLLTTRYLDPCQCLPSSCWPFLNAQNKGTHGKGTKLQFPILYFTAYQYYNWYAPLGRKAMDFFNATYKDCQPYLERYPRVIVQWHQIQIGDKVAPFPVILETHGDFTYAARGKDGFAQTVGNSPSHWPPVAGGKWWSSLSMYMLSLIHI